ncbi:hypothetical protein SALB1_2003 [Salinisphaera sp. LB1]|nr:hypothetical protein SALB1_2003 [Salinisphaera sp. LB1]
MVFSAWSRSGHRRDLMIGPLQGSVCDREYLDARVSSTG